MNTSLGAIPEMLYCNNVRSGRSPDTPVEAHDGMKWFRSNIRLGSRLALFALGIQCLLSFGHFHSSNAQAAPASVDAKQLGRHDTVSFAATRLAALDNASRTSSDQGPDGQPSDDCAICAVMALANAMVVATPPYLLARQAAALLYLTADAEFVHLNSARVAFQPRAPPIS